MFTVPTKSIHSWLWIFVFFYSMEKVVKILKIFIWLISCYHYRLLLTFSQIFVIKNNIIYTWKLFIQKYISCIYVCLMSVFKFLYWWNKFSSFIINNSYRIIIFQVNPVNKSSCSSSWFKIKIKIKLCCYCVGWFFWLFFCLFCLFWLYLGRFAIFLLLCISLFFLNETSEIFEPESFLAFGAVWT